jgi:hypothetical protein
LVVCECLAGCECEACKIARADARRGDLQLVAQVQIAVADEPVDVSHGATRADLGPVRRAGAIEAAGVMDGNLAAQQPGRCNKQHILRVDVWRLKNGWASKIEPSDDTAKSVALRPSMRKCASTPLRFAGSNQ